MPRLKQTIAACILVIALSPAVPAQAATYYVATTGNNSNPGTSSSPWRTVAYAVSKMVAGDTTYVRGGTYKESTIQFLRSGTSSSPIKLLNAPGQYPIIDFVDKASGKLIVVGGNTIARGWITIEGFEIKNGYHGIKINNVHDLTIRRNWIHDSRNSGIYANGVRILIDRNRINRNALGTSGPGGHGIYANGTAFTITNNLIYDNWTYGIQQNGSSTSLYNPNRHAGPEYALSANWVVANNTIAYNRHNAGMVVWGSTCNNARIENNIFYENAVNLSSSSTQGIHFISTTCKGVTIRNNFAFASGSGGTRFTPTPPSGVTLSGNIVNTLNPKFVNAPATLPSAPNFALASESPAINKGLTTSATKQSYTNVSRPQQSLYDIGAFEFLNNSASLAAPTSLQLAN